MEEINHHITHIVHHPICHKLLQLTIIIVKITTLEMDNKNNIIMPSHTNPKPTKLHYVNVKLINNKLHNRNSIWLLTDNIIIKRYDLFKRLMVNKLTTIYIMLWVFVVYCDRVRIDGCCVLAIGFSCVCVWVELVSVICWWEY